MQLNANVRVDAVKLDMLREHYQQCFQKEPGKKSKQILLAEVSKYYIERAKEGLGLAHCDVCGADTDYAFDSCPLCGSTEVDDSSAPEEGAKKKGKKKDSLVAADKPQETTYTENDLQVEVDAFWTLQQDVSKNYWQIGKHLKNIFDKSLWRLQKSADGLPQFTSFDQFVKSVFGWSKAHAYKAIGVCETYTLEQINTIGRSKLGLMLQLPDEERAKLLESGDAKKKSLSELRGAIGTEEDANKKEAAATKKKIVDGTTIVFEGSSHVVKLFAKKQPEDASEPTARAKEIDDRPWGKIVSENGVEVVVVLKRGAQGNLELHMETLRSE